MFVLFVECVFFGEFDVLFHEVVFVDEFLFLGGGEGVGSKRVVLRRGRHVDVKLFADPSLG